MSTPLNLADTVQISVTNAPTNVSVGVAGVQGGGGSSTTINNTIGVTGISITGGIGMTGAVNISAGGNITLTQAGSNNFSIAAAGGSSDVSGLISTGLADLRYIQTGASGGFYRTSNPNNFSSSGNVENTGTLLQNQINNLSAVRFVTGSGTANYIPKFTKYGSGLQNSVIIELNDNIGIGISNPTEKLNISGNIKFENTSAARQITCDNGGYIKFGQNAASNRRLDISGFSDGFYLQQGINFGNQQSNGTNSYIGAANAGIFFQSSSGPNDSAAILLKHSQGSDYNNPVIRVWDESEYNQHRIFGVGHGSTYKEIFTVRSNSGVGILTTSPISALDVSGNIYAIGGKVLTAQDSGNILYIIENTGTTLQNQITSIKNGTGVFIQSSNLNGFITTGNGDTRYLSSGVSGQFYLVSNPAQYIKSGEVNNISGALSTKIELTGTNLQNQLGNYYPITNPNNFSSSGNVEVTGTNLQNQITSVKNGTGVFIQVSNLVGLISTGAGDLRYLNTGISGYFYPVSNPNQFIQSGNVNNISGSLQQNIERSGGYLYGLINASSAGVSSINLASGAITIAGAGNVSVTTSAQTITVSGATGFLAGYYTVSNPEHFMKSGEATNVNLSGLSTSGNVEATGTSLQNQIFSIRNGTGVFLQSSNLAGLISTGSADLRFLNTGSSGDFYRSSNPNQFIKSGDVNNSYVHITGDELIHGLKRFSGIIAANTISGISTTAKILLLDGGYLLGSEGNTSLAWTYRQMVSVAGDTCLNWNDKQLLIPGDIIALDWGNLQLIGNWTINNTGISSLTHLENTGTLLQNQIDGIRNGTGVFIQSSNLNGLITTGSADIRYLQTGVSGEFYKSSNPNNFIRSGDVNTISGALSTRLESTGGYLYSLINASSAGVSSINAASGAITLNGAGNVTVITVGTTITVSGNTGEYINFYKTSNPNNFIRSGDFSLGGLISTGSADLRYLQTGVSGEFYKSSNPNNFASSGNVQSTGTAIYNLINTFSGNQQSFITGMNPTGLDNYYIGYPRGSFSVAPRILLSVEISGTNMYAVNITGRSTAGFHALFSDVIAESGVILHVFATINN